MPRQDKFLDFHFPKAGIVRSKPAHRQPARPTSSGYARTCWDGLNVRAFDPRTNRGRGGSRPMLARALASQPVADWLIQELNVVVGAGYDVPGGAVQLSLSGRVVTIVAVSQGNVYVASPGDAAWTIPTNNTGATPPLTITGIVRSAANNQKLYFADGNNYRYYTPATNSVENWTATAGTLPVDSANNKPRLICTWRGRTVLSGLIKDPQNWFMSAVSDPNDFDYSPLSVTPTQAIAGNNSSLGLIGDVINTMIPYTDDVLIFGGDSTIYTMRGDPMAGGQIDLVSDTVGMAFGIPWCRDPSGVVYFFSNRCAIYSMIPGQAPVRISQGIESILQQIDTGANTVRMMWEDRFQWLHVFVSPTGEPATDPEDVTHFCYEVRTGAWFKDRFQDTDYDPLTCCVIDGNEVDDRVGVIGSWDGYVRFFDPDATKDDLVKCESSVVIGPILTDTMDDVMLKEIQAVLGDNSGEVTWQIFAADTAELATVAIDDYLEKPTKASLQPQAEGTWMEGRNPTEFIRTSGHAIYIRLSSTNRWAMENVRALAGARGKVRGRDPGRRS